MRTSLWRMGFNTNDVDDLLKIYEGTTLTTRTLNEMINLLN